MPEAIITRATAVTASTSAYPFFPIFIPPKALPEHTALVSTPVLPQMKA